MSPCIEEGYSNCLPFYQTTAGVCSLCHALGLQMSAGTPRPPGGGKDACRVIPAYPSGHTHAYGNLYWYLHQLGHAQRSPQCSPVKVGCKACERNVVAISLLVVDQT